MFQLTKEEENCLRSQIVTLNNHGRGQHHKSLPYVFTAQATAQVSDQVSDQADPFWNKLQPITVIEKHKEFQL